MSISETQGILQKRASPLELQTSPFLVCRNPKFIPFFEDLYPFNRLFRALGLYVEFISLSSPPPSSVLFVVELVMKMQYLS